MGFAKNHPAVVAMFRLHQATADEIEKLKADKATFDETANVRSMFERQLLQLALRLGEWGWAVDGGTLVTTIRPNSLVALSPKTMRSKS